MKYLMFMREISRLVLFVSLIFVSVNSYSQNVDVKTSKVRVVFAGKKYYLHEIKQGQTLYSVCKYYNVDLLEVLKINKKDEAVIKLGEVLRLPDNGQEIGVAKKKKPNTELSDQDVNEVFFSHIATEGETLFLLSEKYDISMSSILNLNPNLKVKLNSGDIIRIPKIVYDEVIYTVGRRDNKESVLARFGITYQQLLDHNSDIRKSRLFRKGTDLNIRRKREVVNYSEISTEENIISSEDSFNEESLSEENFQDTIPTITLLEEQNPLRGKVNIALFLPFYLNENDKLNNISDSGNRTVISNKILKKSKTFIRFYQGVLMAVDSLKNKGVDVDLFVYDTERSVTKVQSILNNNNFEEIDFIIGPVYKETFETVAEFVKDKNIPLIFPLSNNTKAIKSNKNVFQINTSLNGLCKHIADYLSIDLENKNIVVIQKDETVLNANRLIEGIEYHLFEEGKRWNKDNISYKKISIDKHGLYGIKHTLSDTCENIIILPSTNRPIVENVIRNLNVLSKKYKIKLIGFSLWLKFSSMDPYVLFNLNTSIFSSRYLDYKSENIDAFVKGFRTQYNAEPNDYAFRAYDICTYFSNLSRKYNKSYLGLDFKYQTNQLQSNFSFEKVNPLGGYENVGLMKISYNDNYTIEVETINFKNEK